MNINDWLRHATSTLAESGCPDPAIDARWMAEDVLHMTHTDLKFEGDREVGPIAHARLNAMLRRRAAGEPVQYILQRADFMGLTFHVDGRVLIPRQDTETLVEYALIAVTELSSPVVLDLCAGSGCIGLSLKNLAPRARVTLADLSADALEVARINAAQLDVEVAFRQGDLFDAVAGEHFDVIVSNPPYIPHAELSGLQREVQHEPAMALDGGRDGLDFYRRIARGTSAHLNPGGTVCLEVGIGEAEAVQQLLGQFLDCADSGIQRDLNGIPRVVWARSK